MGRNVGDDRDTVEAKILETQTLDLLLRQIRKEWAHLCWLHFRERLRPPTFAIVDARSFLARWIRGTRTIEISARFVLDQPWGSVVEVLKHEMAHQYVDEVLGVRDETAHGPTFREVCQELGIDSGATGLPTAAPPTDEQAKVLDRIRRLLSLAGSSNPHEAETAMRTARKLMLEYNVEELAHPTTSGYAWRHLGKPTGRREEHERILASILHEHFFVETIVVPVYRVQEGKAGTVLEVIGSETNVALAAYVHDFLLHTGDALWRAHKREKGIRGDKDRRTFLAGVMRGFRDKLETERKTSEATGLVWVGDPGLDRFFRKRHPRVHRVKSTGRERTGAFHEGRAAGKNIVLHRPLEQGAAGAGPKLLRG